MSTIQVTVPDALRTFVEEQAAAEGYGSASDYVCALLHEAEKRRARAAVEQLLLEGLRSGPPIEATQEYWDAKRRKLEQFTLGLR